jgi:hypothetical protein
MGKLVVMAGLVPGYFVSVRYWARIIPLSRCESATTFVVCLSCYISTWCLDKSASEKNGSLPCNLCLFFRPSVRS